MIKKLLFFLSFLALLGVSAFMVRAERPLIEDINQKFGEWDSPLYYIVFDGDLQIGDKIIIRASGAQIQISYVDYNNPDGYLHTATDKDGNNRVHNGDYLDLNGNPIEISVTDKNVEVLNRGGLSVNGKNFTLNSVSYEGNNNELAATGGAKENFPQDPNNPSNPPQPSETYDGTLLFDSGNDKGLDLWMEWDNPQYYLVKFNHVFEEGDVIIFDLWENYGGTLKIAINNPGWDEVYENNPGSKHEWTLTADQAAAVNKEGVFLQGNNLKVNKISYRGKNPVVSGGLVQKQIKGGDLVDQFEDNYGGNGESEELDPNRKTQDLKGSFGTLEVINQTRGDVTLNGLTFSGNGEDEDYFIAGVIAEAIANVEGDLDNETYNGHRNEFKEYPNDPLAQLNRWEKVIVELEEAVTNARVVIYYRDLDYDSYKKSNEFPLIYNFSGTKCTVDLDPYRYIRAIAIAIPEGETATVKEFFLYEREDYDPDEVEIWVPGEGVDSMDMTYEGHFLGAKVNKPNKIDDNDWTSGDELVANAWQTAIEIPGNIIAEAVDQNAEYQAFAIVYKDGIPRGDANAQLQLYVNFPFYQTEKKNGEWQNWIGKYWYESNEEDNKDKEDHLILDYVNLDSRIADGNGSYTVNGIYTPNVRESHSLIPYGREVGGHEGSYFVEVPREKEGIYTYGTVYIKTSKSVEYPVLLEEDTKADMAKRRAEAEGTSEGIQTQTGNVLELAKKYGLAIRGQNMTIMKVVYLGAIGIQEDEENQVELTIGSYNDRKDDNRSDDNSGIIRHAFSSDEITLEDLIILDKDWTYGEDFILHLEPATTEAAWQTYTGSNPDSNYERLFNEYSSSLNSQYDKCGRDAMVDGFYRGSGSVKIKATYDTDLSTNDIHYYNVLVTVPCSGVYVMTFETIGEKEGKVQVIGDLTHEIIIYPYLLNKFNDTEYGFNIGGYTFTNVEEGKIILPKDYKGDFAKAPTSTPGTYFVNEFTTVNQNPQNMKRRADEPSAVADAPGLESHMHNVNLSELKDADSPNITSTVVANITKNGATAQYTFTVSKDDGYNTSTGVEAIGTEAGEAVYYNLQGVRVNNPENGVFVKVVNGKAEKVIL